MNENKENVRVLVTSERWSPDAVEMPWNELENLAEFFTQDRIGSGEIDDKGPVKVRIEGTQVIDETGDVVGTIIE